MPLRARTYVRHRALPEGTAYRNCVSSPVPATLVPWQDRERPARWLQQHEVARQPTATSRKTPQRVDSHPWTRWLLLLVALLAAAVIAIVTMSKHEDALEPAVFDQRVAPTRTQQQRPSSRSTIKGERGPQTNKFGSPRRAGTPTPTGTCAIRGAVRWSSDRKPVPGAWVAIAQANNLRAQWTTKTDAAGRFAFRKLKKTPHVLQVTVQITNSRNRVTQQRSVDPTEAGPEATQDFIIPCCEIRGRVVDDALNGVPNARVIIRGNHHDGSGRLKIFELTSDQTGSFRAARIPMRGISISLRITPAAPGFWGTSAKRKARHSDSIRVQLSMKPTEKRTRIRGIVVDAAGSPVQGAFVYSLWMNKRDLSLPASRTGNLLGIMADRCRTDEEGRFSIEKLLPRREHELVAVAPGHAGCVSRRLLIPKRGQLADVRLQLGRGDSTLRGTIVNDRGQAVRGARVIAFDQSYAQTHGTTSFGGGSSTSGIAFWTYSNDRGEYELPLVPGRTYWVQPSRDGHRSPEGVEFGMRLGGKTLPLRVKRKR